jgi:hypothetical protein
VGKSLDLGTCKAPLRLCLPAITTAFSCSKEGRKPRLISNAFMTVLSLRSNSGASYSGLQRSDYSLLDLVTPRYH